MDEISFGNEQLSFIYKSNVEDESLEKEQVERHYVQKLTDNIDREIAVGSSLYGVHRDDLEIFINGKEARLFASQGQQRSIVLAMKLAEGEVVREVCGEYPVFLFDDVLSELDSGRRKYVLDGIGERQIIITSCEKEFVEGISENVITVKGGEYTDVSSHR